MILNGFCLSCSASSRTTIGGLMVMTCASAGRTIFGAAGASGFGRAGFCRPANLAPGNGGPAGRRRAAAHSCEYRRAWRSRAAAGLDGAGAAALHGAGFLGRLRRRVWAAIE